MNDNYNTPEDFINDQSFTSWVFKTNENEAASWEKWFTNHPSKKNIAIQAAGILRAIQIKEAPVSEAQLTAAESRLRRSIKAAIPAKIISLKTKKIWYAAAAVSIIAVCLSIFFTYNFSGKLKLATKYGQVKKDKLPDGTEIILNAHSTITYGKEWKEGTGREVWLKGEAFFHVKKTPEHDKFIVHTDAFDIEVTGTSFNVINLDGKSSVVLKEGSVKIHRDGQPEIIMKPGDFVEFTNENKQIQKKQVTKDDYIAWTDNKIVFDSTSLKEVATIIKQHYGVEVYLQGNNIDGETINGIMSNNNLEVLLQTLDALPGIKVAHTKDTVTLITEIQ